ncbi:hypothetical protein AB0O07_07110 [Streptomyces sp. NPDC093085]|uniref:hypothetical protein n=1 Tax=Streptomyces sp. NPDC093085 TaxID=3155068 RepID=UPI0034255CBF
MRHAPARRRDRQLLADRLGREPVLVATLVVMGTARVLAIAVTFLAGSLTDGIGRRPLCLAGRTAAILFAFPMYLLTNTGHP